MTPSETRANRAGSAIAAVLAEDTNTLWEDEERTLQASMKILERLAGR